MAHSKKILAALVLAFMGLAMLSLVAANPYPFHFYSSPPVPSKPVAPPAPKIDLFSPTNATYSKDNVTVEFTVTKTLDDNQELAEIYYSVDTQKCDLKTASFVSFPNPLNYTMNVKGLTDGNHTLKISAATRSYVNYAVVEPTFGAQEQRTIYSDLSWNTVELAFRVDAVPPNITLQSPQNLTYQPTESIPLKCIVNEPITQLTFNLDNQGNVTLEQDSVLVNLPTGTHSITIYATDNVGNIGASSTIYFSVTAQEKPLFELQVLALAAAVSFASLVLISLMFRKRRRKTSNAD